MSDLLRLLRWLFCIVTVEMLLLDMVMHGHCLWYRLLAYTSIDRCLINSDVIRYVMNCEWWHILRHYHDSS